MSGVAIVHNIPIHYQHLLFTELARRGVQFEVLFVAAKSRHRQGLPDLASARYRHRTGFSGYYEDAPAAGSFVFTLRSLQKLNPSTVIVAGWRDAADWAAWLWALARRRRRILWMESTAADHPRAAWKESVKRLFVAPFHLAHVYGTASRDYLLKLGMPAGKIVTGRVVVDAALFASCDPRTPGTNRPRVLLYVGRFSPEKNLETLIRAMAICQARGGRGVKLALVGYGPTEPQLRKLVSELGLTGCIEFRGPAKQAELPAVYGSADALVLPSLSETWGLVVNEAMLCGLPVLVSDRCGCAADLVTADTGWTFPPEDCEALAALIERIAAMSQEELWAMGAAARTLALAYTPEECARAVAGCIDRVSGAPPRRSVAGATA